MRRRVNSPPTPRFVPSFGYVSLFPLMMQLLPPASDELGATLAALNDTSLLWTSAGLRSLATTSSLYKKYNTEHDAPYWRGQVWINLNFLTLRALRHYGQVAGPHQRRASELHDQLRDNLVSNIAGQYSATGYLWEQYDDASGQGRGSHPFTGWTALVALIATGAY
jgi:mannosyl-oligosaccharide glucosidase